jgi:Spy/CpxP family protein refolding chaperone
MRSMSRLLFAGVAAFGAAGCAMAQELAPPPPQAERAHPLQGAADWRARMQKLHSANQSVEQQVSRLTRDLELTPEQQEKVRQLSIEHNDKIQKILDTAPPTLTYDAFNAQAHAISRENHTAVDAILTPHQRELVQAMVARLDSGQERRHTP